VGPSSSSAHGCRIGSNAPGSERAWIGDPNVLTMALRARGFEPETLMELGSTTAIKAAVHADVGPAVLSHLAVTSELRAGQLIAVPCAELQLARSIRAIWAQGQSLSRPATHLIEIATGSRAARR
jgi:DNA-binding transcriptional LysR family regulator